MSARRQEVLTFDQVDGGEVDDVLVVAASWERRCLGLVERLGNYRARKVLLVIYDGTSALKEEHIKLLRERLPAIGPVAEIPTLHANPLESVRETVERIRKESPNRPPRIAIDVSTLTRKHLLQLLQGLDRARQLTRCRLFHTEPLDYDTRDDEPMAEGISEVKAIETFSGDNVPSRDSVLILFLGYEGRRSQALWEHLEPNILLAVIPDPPYRPEWSGRTENQNRYLLSCISKERVYRCDSLDPDSSLELLEALVSEYDHKKYRFQVAPVGTKAQTIGIYRFWRRNPALLTIMYASPTRYRQERGVVPPGRSWCLADTSQW